LTGGRETDPQGGLFKEKHAGQECRLVLLQLDTDDNDEPPKKYI